VSEGWREGLVDVKREGSGGVRGGSRARLLVGRWVKDGCCNGGLTSMMVMRSFWRLEASSLVLSSEAVLPKNVFLPGVPTTSTRRLISLNGPAISQLSPEASHGLINRY
jgi:hypothetical protein